MLRFPSRSGFGAQELLPNLAQDEAQAWLARASNWPLGQLALWGAPGSGKSHLAHAWAASVGGAVVSSAPDGWPAAPIAIDDIDAIPSEPALLHLLNAAAEARQPVLLVSRMAPGRLPVRLPDLASRLRATTAVSIGAADDAFLVLLLGHLLANRQLMVPVGLTSWMLTRLPRNPAALRDAVGTLDAASLQMGRPITRALATDILGLHERSAASAEEPSPSGRSPG